MYDESAWFGVVCSGEVYGDWSMTAEELPCLLAMRVTRAAGRPLPRLQGFVAPGPAV